MESDSISRASDADLGFFRFIQPVRIEYEPMPDITAYELAKLLPLFFRQSIMPSDVPVDPAVRRHLKVTDPNTPTK
jgi:hypothetical protein